MEKNNLLMKGKKGLIMGVANEKSIAWGIAEILSKHGAQLAFTYQGSIFEKRVKPLADSLGCKVLLDCDVKNSSSISKAFDTLKKEWGSIDFLVHSIAFSDKDELKGKYIDTSRENFLNTLEISCYSFTEVCKHAANLMQNGGSILTLSYIGAERVMPHYNVMGIAKAALEASVKYLAADLGNQSIRVNAISAGPMKTLAASAIGSVISSPSTRTEYNPVIEPTSFVPARSSRRGKKAKTDGVYPFVVGASPTAKPTSRCACATRVRESIINMTFFFWSEMQ